MNTSRKLEGKVAIVTGAGQGIGRSIAIKLASEGASILANDIDEANLVEIQKEIGSHGSECRFLCGDVTASDFGDRIVESAVSQFGDIHILVNNAGYIWNSRIANHTDEQWYAMIDVHATAPFRILRAAGGFFKNCDRSVTRKVINISSVSGLFGADTQFSYSAAKSALTGMTKSLARDWGRYNITVNCVAFGFIETRLTQPFDEEIPEIRIGEKLHRVGISRNQIAQMKAAIPLGRLGTQEDAANAVYLFCIPESDYITGEIIVAGGGLRG